MPRDHQEVQRLEADFGGEEGLKARGRNQASLPYDIHNTPRLLADD